LRVHVHVHDLDLDSQLEQNLAGELSTPLGLKQLRYDHAHWRVRGHHVLLVEIPTTVVTSEHDVIV
jgi:hypothetical protein